MTKITPGINHSSFTVRDHCQQFSRILSAKHTVYRQSENHQKKEQIPRSLFPLHEKSPFHPETFLPGRLISFS